MCGITGIIHPKAEIYIQAMTDAIRHRGPDDSGIYNNGNLSLGHRRLAIQDLSANGHQPMFTEDRRYCIVFNGEIYNHWDIRKNIENKYKFVSTCDTETLLYGFVEYGFDLFNMLNGIFAFAIFDHHTNELVIVRDQFGVKPLYYYRDKEMFIFSSEIKGINTVPNIDRTLDSKALLNYLKFLWSPGERTPFCKVKKLLPCYYLKINLNTPEKIELIKYYTIPFSGQYIKKSEKEWIEELDNQLFEAVKRQLLSDIPIGFFLSGGLDSSAIVAMAKRALPHKRLKCYTIDSGSKDMEQEGFADDIKYAKIVAKHLDVDLTVISGKVDIMASFDKMVYQLDEPQADIAPLHVLNICTKAREEGYLVLLGGTAGDDVFSGYRRHQALKYEKYFRFVPKLFISISSFFIKNIQSSNVNLRRFKKIILDFDKPPIDRQVGYFAWISNSSAKSLFNENIKKYLTNYEPLEILKNTFAHIPLENNPLNKMLYLEMKYFLPDHNLNYTDKLSMAVGVEVRVPFLDKELVEFSTKIPPHLKMKGTTTKYLLKKVMEKYLPHEVIYRPKAGFGAPVRTWIKTKMQTYLTTTFSKENVNEEGIFNYDAVKALLNNNASNKYDGSYTILSLLSIRAWINQYVHSKK